MGGRSIQFGSELRFAWIVGLSLYAGIVGAAAASAADPVPLESFGTETGPATALRDAVSAAVTRHPAIVEAKQNVAVARASRSETHHGLFPTVDVGATTSRTITSDFGNNLATLVERSQTDRTDLTLGIDQLLFDFGSVSRQIKAANARLESAGERVGDTASLVALQTISAFFDLLAYQRLLFVAQSYADGQRRVHDAVTERIEKGVSSRAEQMRVDAAIGRAEARIAQFQRAKADAEQRYFELTALQPPAELARPQLVALTPASADLARAAADQSFDVQAARGDAEAARQDARAAKSQLLPTLNASITAGRYGIFEDLSDYDMRARLTLRQRLFGPDGARADRFGATAKAQSAHADQVREEAERDAATAWTNLASLQQEVEAQRNAYVAASQSRDAQVERFRVARGTLLDVLDAQEIYFTAASSFVLAVSQRDQMHYQLLQKTGRLLAAFDLASPNERYAGRSRREEGAK